MSREEKDVKWGSAQFIASRVRDEEGEGEETAIDRPQSEVWGKGSMEKALKERVAQRTGGGTLPNAEKSARGLDREELEARARLRTMSQSDIEEAAKVRAEALRQSVESRPKEKKPTPWPKCVIDMTDVQLDAYIRQMAKWRTENISWWRRFVEGLFDFIDIMGNGPKYAMWNGYDHSDQTEDVAAQLAELWERDPYRAAERQKMAKISVRRELARIQSSAERPRYNIRIDSQS